jgi:hypothetical protein
MEPLAFTHPATGAAKAYEELAHIQQLLARREYRAYPYRGRRHMLDRAAYLRRILDMEPVK